LVSACSSSGNGSSDAQPAIAEAAVERTPASAISTDVMTAAVTANNALAVDLYQHVLAGAGSGNVLISPVSASFALTMTYAGAVGDTATEMASALHIDPSAGSAIFDGQNALSQALTQRGTDALARAQQNAQSGNQPAPSADDYDLNVVNSVWGEKTYPWEQPFLTILAQDYGTGVYQEDFIHAFEPARAAINSWVSDETKDKINDLLPAGSLDSTTRMVLVNALHLKFPWEHTFDPTQTASGDFTLASGSTVSTSFMNQSQIFNYSDDGKAQIASLPLSNGELSLVVALPHAGVDLASYEASLSATSFDLTATGDALVQLSLPKTQFTSPSVSLKNALEAMGMQRAFDAAAADFSGICAHPPDGGKLSVSDVLQKAMISMQESGVEAAAATAVVLRDAAVELPPMQVTMAVNRPYLVALVDNPTGAILMLGQIVDPTDAGSP
jgi:serpin B